MQDGHVNSVLMTRKKWVSKIKIDMRALGKTIKIWKQRIVDIFPRCNAQYNAPTHILTYKSTG